MPSELDITILRGGVPRCGHPTCRLPLDENRKCPFGHEQRFCAKCGYPMTDEGGRWRCHNCGEEG